MLLETGYIGIGYVLCLIVSKLKNKFTKQNYKPEIFVSYVLNSDPNQTTDNIIKNIEELIPNISGLQYIIKCKYIDSHYKTNFPNIAKETIENISKFLNFNFTGSLKNFDERIFLLLKNLKVHSNEFVIVPTILFKITVDINPQSLDPVLANFDYRHTKFLKP